MHNSPQNSQELPSTHEVIYQFINNVDPENKYRAVDLASNNQQKESNIRFIKKLQRFICDIFLGDAVCEE